MLWLLLTTALAGPRVEQSIVIDAEPEVIYGLVADLAAWGDWASIGPGAEGVRSSVRGDAYTDDQLLLWTGGGLGTGRLAVREVHETSLSFDLARTTFASAGTRTWTRWKQNTTISWAPEGDGTRVTWNTRTRNRTAAKKNVTAVVESRLDALKRAAESDSTAPSPRPATVVERSDILAAWQGLEHSWSYNHKLNRLGSWVVPPDCDEGDCTVDLVHAAASSTGRDEAQLRRGATLVRANGLDVHYGRTTLWFRGREGAQLVDSTCIQLPEGQPGQVLINGIDIDATESADSLWAFSLSTRRQQTDGREEVCVDGKMKMACRSVDCRRGSKTRYTIDVHWAHVIAPGMVATPAPHEEHMEWGSTDIRDMVHVEEHRSHEAWVGTPGMPAAAVGLTSMSVTLSQSLHSKGLELDVHPSAYDPATGTMTGDLTLFYQQWGAVEIAPGTLAQFSKSGTADLAATTVLLQWPTGCSTSVERPGELFWPGGGEDGTDSGAEARVTVEVPTCAEGPPAP